MNPKAKIGLAPAHLPGPPSRGAGSGSPTHGAREKRPFARKPPEKKSQADKLHRRTIDTTAKKLARKKRPRRNPAEAVAVAVGAAPDQTDLNNRVKIGRASCRERV